MRTSARSRSRSCSSFSERRASIASAARTSLTDGKACRGECSFDLLLGLGFLRQEGHFGPGALHELSLQLEFSFGGELFEYSAKDFRAKASREQAAQIFSGHSRLQRIFLVKALYAIGGLLRQIGESRNRIESGSFWRHQADSLGCREASNRVQNLSIGPASTRRNLLLSQAKKRAFHQLKENFGFVAALHRQKKSFTRRFPGARAAWNRVGHHSSADGGERRRLPDDETIAREQQHGVPELELREGLAPGGDLPSVKQRDLGHGLKGAAMEMHLCPVLQFGCQGEKFELHVGSPRGPKAAGSRQGHTALQRMMIDTGKVDGRALAGFCAFGGFAARMNAAHAQAFAARKELHFVARGDAAAKQRAGYDGAKSLDRESAVDRQAEVAARIFAGNLEGLLQQGFFQIREARFRFRTDGNNRRALEKRTAKIVFHFQAREFERIAVDQIGLGENNQAALDPQQAADVEVFAGLRLDGLIRGNDQQHQIHSRRAREHVADKTFMAGNIHETKLDAALFQEREAKIDRDSAALFFFQAVGVGAGKGFNQRRFAVVDMAGGTDDDVLRHERPSDRYRRDAIQKVRSRSNRGGLLCGGDFVHNRLGRRARVTGGGDRTANHQVVGAR